jgi:hypothetical protein
VIDLITWEGVGAARRGNEFELWEAGLLGLLADGAPSGRRVVAVWGCCPCLGVGKLDVLDVDALPLLLLWVPVLRDHDVEDAWNVSAPGDLELHIRSGAQAVLGEKVGGDTHTACEAIVIGWEVVERLDVTSMEGDGGHAEVGVERVDLELMGCGPPGLADLVGSAKRLGHSGVAWVGN